MSLEVCYLSVSGVQPQQLLKNLPEHFIKVDTKATGVVPGAVLFFVFLRVEDISSIVISFFVFLNSDSERSLIALGLRALTFS